MLAVDSRGGLEWTTPSGGGGSVSDPIEFTTEPDTAQNYLKADFGTSEIGLARYNSNDDFVNGVNIDNSSLRVADKVYLNGGGEELNQVELTSTGITFQCDSAFVNGQLSWGSDSSHLGFDGTDLALSSDLPQPDGTTITESNGVWSAVGGGGSGSYTWTDELYTIYPLDATGLADMGTALSNGLIYPVVKYLTEYYHLVKYKQQQNGRHQMVYWSNSFSSSSYKFKLPIINIQFNSDYSLYDAGVNDQYCIPMDARGLNVISGQSVTNAASNVGADLLYIRNNYALKTEIPTAQANAASALYLKDTNNVVYQITVGTDGTLSATAV